MGAAWMALALMGLAGCGVLFVHLWRQNREMERLTEQIEHFLLYPRDAPAESLAEGEAANLYNQISRLEQALLLQEESAARREDQMVRFTENIAHQMMNSLTALQIQLDMLGLQAGEAERETLQKSQRCMDRLTNEIDRILQSSQLAEGKIAMRFEPLDLRLALDTCRERLAPVSATRDVKIRVTGPESLPLPADPFWLPQALENVLKNAVEHTAPGSWVTVILVDAGQSARILVEDEGAGIPPEDLAALFQRFHRGKTAKAGYGIGLSMAKDVIAAHHGAITARNRESGGVAFEIVLPVMDGARAYPGN